MSKTSATYELITVADIKNDAQAATQDELSCRYNTGLTTQNFTQ